MSLLNHSNVLFLACLILLKLAKYPSCLVFDLPRRRIVLALGIFIVFTDLIFSLGHMNLAKSARQHLFCLVLPFLYMLLFGACPVAQLFPKKRFFTLCSALQRVLIRVILSLLLKSDTPSPHSSVHARLHQQNHSLYKSVKIARSSRHFSPWLLSKEIKPTSCAPSSTSSPCGSSKTALTYLRVDTSFKP